MSSYDVIIAGAGPVGLSLSVELALSGVSVLVLERDSDPNSPWKHGPFGLRGLNIPSVESFYRRGLLDRVRMDFPGTQTPRLESFQPSDHPQRVGHFAGITLDGNKVDFSKWKYHLPGPSYMPCATNFGKLQEVLTERAEALGVTILRGKPVSRLSEEEDQGRVRVWAGDAEHFTAQYLVGCDGGHSAVRKLAEFSLEGTESEWMGYAVQATVTNVDQLQSGFAPTAHGMYIQMGPQNFYVVDYASRDFDRSQPVTKAHFQDVLRRVSEHPDLVVTDVDFASTYTDRCQQVTQYRRGRVLLAGDSAHTHSPMGAQGLNVGLGDTMNLGWKLAATIRGAAAPGLLDTYHADRHPVGASILEWTRMQTATLRPDAHGRAIATMVRAMLDTRDGTMWFVERFWGISMRYGGEAVPHPLVGLSVPDFEFQQSGDRLGARMSRPCFVVVDFESRPEIERFVCSLGAQAEYVGGKVKESFGLQGLLVRPDGHIAWVAENRMDVGALKNALSKWIQLETQEES